MTEPNLQPDAEFIIETLQEEIQALNSNRMYLISVVKQMKNEFEQARTAWEAEKQSLLTDKIE